MPVHTRRMYFHAQAVGFGGIIGKVQSKPSEILVDNLGVSALSGAGGRHKQEVTRSDIPQNLQRWVDFDRITVFTEGRFTDPNAVFKISESKDKSVDEGKLPTTTTSEVTVENLSLLGGIFKAGLIRAKMVGQWPQPEEDSPIFIERPAFEKIEVRQKGVEVLLDQNILGASTIERLEHEHKRCSDSFFEPKGDIGTKIADVFKGGPYKNKNGEVHYTFVTGLKGEGIANDRNQPNRLTVKDFGQIFFGEVIASKSSRRVALLRFALGSEEGANFEIGSMEKNGSWSP